MTPADVPSACALLNRYLAKSKLAPVFSEADFGHWLLPRPDVVDSFVVVDAYGAVTDLCRCGAFERERARERVMHRVMIRVAVQLLGWSAGLAGHRWMDGWKAWWWPVALFSP
jgi:hypothetical protein